MNNKKNMAIKPVPTKYELSKNETEYGDNNEFASFVGIRYEKNQLRIHYPQTLFDSLDELKIEEKETKKVIKELLLSIKLSKISSEENEIESKSVNTIDSMPIYSFLWIIDDFKKNGRILNFEEKNCFNNGKINWKKTLNQDYYIYNDNLIITDFICSRKNKNEDLITEIYDYCIYKSIETLFLLVNLSNNIIYPIHKRLTKGLLNKYRQAILDELDQTFDDEKRIRFNNMLLILNSEKGIETKSDNVYGVNEYAPVFEKMIDSIFGSKIIRKEDYYPHASLKICNSDNKELSKIRPDTINLDFDKKILLIVDSKFYESGSMPQTESVVKQIAYGKYAKTIKPECKVYNIFLIPKHLCEGKVLDYIGYSYWEWNNNTEEYEYILSYYIDLKFVLMNYKKGNDDRLIEMIKEDAESKINEIMGNNC